MKLGWIFKLSQGVFVTMGSSCLALLMLLLTPPVFITLATITALFWWRMSQFPNDLVALCLGGIALMWFLGLVILVIKAIRMGSSSQRHMQDTDAYLREYKSLWAEIERLREEEKNGNGKHHLRHH